MAPGTPALRAPATAFARRQVVGTLVGVVFLGSFFAVFLFGHDYVRFVAELMLINAVAAMGVNLAMGFAGLVSIGHAGFGAIAAYGATLLMARWNVPYLLALPLSACLSAAAGVIIGLPALRLNPLYIAMVTYGFGQAVQYTIINWIDVTRGPNGMTVPPIDFFGYDASAQALLLLTGLVAGLLFWLSWNIRRTYPGRALMAIRGSAIAAQSMGVPVARYKTMVFGLSAFYGGMAGALYAAASGYINPDAFTFSDSMSYVTMSVVGGIGTLTGPLIGAFILTVLPELLRSYAEYKEFLTGIILLGFLVSMPGGLSGLAHRLANRLRGAKER